MSAKFSPASSASVTETIATETHGRPPLEMTDVRTVMTANESMPTATIRSAGAPATYSGG